MGSKKDKNEDGDGDGVLNQKRQVTFLVLLRSTHFQRTRILRFILMIEPQASGFISHNKHLLLLVQVLNKRTTPTLFRQRTPLTS